MTCVETTSVWRQRGSDDLLLGGTRHRSRRAAAALLSLLLLSVALRGCATIRVTDPPRSATEQFLLSEATRKAVEQLSAEALRDRQEV